MASGSLFWDASIDELVQGYTFDEERDLYLCLICNQRFENGAVFQRGSTLYEAKKAVSYHIQDNHNSMFDYLIGMDKKYTGLSEHQKELLQYFKAGLSDKEIVSELTGGSPSTIRNHRFKFKEKEKQAKVFLAIMALLKQEEKEDKQQLIDFHKGATMVDERYAITIEEKEKVLATYFKEGLNGPLTSFPSKEKRKIIVLQQLMRHFQPNQVYSEKEVNTVLESKYSDFATLRRYLIEYGFMDRNKDGTKYWIKN
ncbi:DUF2087 domain-containing protein [Salsuginibacillus kocurii]|uniref:DUF2087 domain-containing protein n=1 Tax=Salsuginibacillus kocurii TaxID=427078 RepID=UPI00035F70F4|nr:DUF2087 domain-containing protein [Salsuginibacillus kocurii]